MPTQQELERTMAVTIEAERQAVINELAQFEASACEIATTLERVIKHPLRSVREAIEPARSAGLVVKRTPLLAVGLATLAGLGAGLVVFGAKQIKRSIPAATSPLLASNFALSLGGILRTEVTRLALVSLSHYLNQTRERRAAEQKLIFQPSPTD